MCNVLLANVAVDFSCEKKQKNMDSMFEVSRGFFFPKVVIKCLSARCSASRAMTECVTACNKVLLLST